MRQEKPPIAGAQEADNNVWAAATRARVGGGRAAGGGLGEGEKATSVNISVPTASSTRPKAITSGTWDGSGSVKPPGGWAPSREQ